MGGNVQICHDLISKNAWIHAINGHIELSINMVKLHGKIWNKSRHRKKIRWIWWSVDLLRWFSFCLYASGYPVFWYILGENCGKRLETSKPLSAKHRRGCHQCLRQGHWGISRKSMTYSATVEDAAPKIAFSWDISGWILWFMVDITIVNGVSKPTNIT